MNDKYLDSNAFLIGRIHAIKLRLAKAERRIERSGEAGNPTEQERAHRLSKVLELHQNNPEEALKLYDKKKQPEVYPVGDNLTEAIKNFQEE